MYKGYGVRSQLPERPEGCCAQLTPDPLTRRLPNRPEPRSGASNHALPPLRGSDRLHRNLSVG